ncbi:hypothetical protein [Halomonas halocynthiae]|uniref:hypothetical protein n=1 Tax=Halomonas halocynthiae TaxID=176290 RepID=UPI00040785FA|nr:hypothetical protein [Halomonas halocynthiae]
MTGHRQYVGLRLSDVAGAVPSVAQMSVGELAINTADGRIYALLAGGVRDITDGYSVAEIDQLLGTKLDADSRYTDAEAVAALRAASDWRAVDWNAAYGWGDHAQAGYLKSVGWAAVSDKPAFSDVATSGAYSDLSGKPDPTDYATASQGAKADSAVQPSDIGTAAAANKDDFDPAGSAASVEKRITHTLQQQSDPLLMHFL